MSSMTPNSTPQKVRRSTGHALPVPYYQGDQPPPKPDYNACPSTQDRLALKRSYEKEMFAYLMKFGTPAIDLCGPCERTNTPCIWHPASPKRCAYCFRGHDICEKWDDTMQSMGRRRLTKSMIRPASSSPEKRRKKEVKIEEPGKLSSNSEQWVMQFTKTRAEWDHSQWLQEREEDKRWRRALFPNNEIANCPLNPGSDDLEDGRTGEMADRVNGETPKSKLVFLRTRPLSSSLYSLRSARAKNGKLPSLTPNEQPKVRQQSPARSSANINVIEPEIPLEIDMPLEQSSYTTPPPFGDATTSVQDLAGQVTPNLAISPGTEYRPRPAEQNSPDIPMKLDSPSPMILEARRDSWLDFHPNLSGFEQDQSELNPAFSYGTPTEFRPIPVEEVSLNVAAEGTQASLPFHERIGQQDFPLHDQAGYGNAPGNVNGLDAGFAEQITLELRSGEEASQAMSYNAVRDVESEQRIPFTGYAVPTDIQEEPGHGEYLTIADLL